MTPCNGVETPTFIIHFPDLKDRSNVQRGLPLKNTIHHINTKPDVLIIGGGAAGVAAAVGAAEQGARVVLIEKNGFLGGKATAAYVGTVCGLYYRSEKKEARYVDDGFPKRFAEALKKRSGTSVFHYKAGLKFLPYDRFAFVRLCDDLMAENRVEVCLHTTVTGLEQSEKNITKLSVLNYHQSIEFYPKKVIDTSGEAIVGRLSDLEMIKSDTYQASAQVFSIKGIATDEEQMLRLNLMRSIRKGLDSGDLSADYQRVSVVPGSLSRGEALFKLGIPLAVNDQLNQISTIETFARKAISEIIDYLRQHSTLFGKASIGMVAPEVGIRTGPRHVGKYILQREDVLSCRKFDDAIARGAWPIELWRPGENPQMDYFAMDDHYDIPARSLQSNQLDNLFFAGRNLSASDEAIASARVIGTCLGMGYGVGLLSSSDYLRYYDFGRR